MPDCRGPRPPAYVGPHRWGACYVCSQVRAFTSVEQAMCEELVEYVGHWWSVWGLCSGVTGSTSVGQESVHEVDHPVGSGACQLQKTWLLKQPHRALVSPSKT